MGAIQTVIVANMSRYLCLLLIPLGLSATAEVVTSSPTDKLYESIQLSVAKADFDIMAATYHPDAILVSEGSTLPVAKVMPRWRESGEQAKAEGGSAAVAFRFSSRQVEESTGFESGIFRYQSTTADGEQKTNYVYFESLTIRKGDRWLTMMERQIKAANKAAWNALPTH